MRRQQIELDDLARDTSADGRGRLLIDLSRLVLTDPPPAGSELATFFDIVRAILPMSAVDYRHRFSETAADHDSVPHDVLCTLATDEARVAEPVLVRSGGLTEPDLVQFASERSDEHRLAIAARAVVSGTVTEVLVRLGSRAVLHRLGGNEGAVFTADAINEISRRAESDEDLFRLLEARKDLGDRLVASLRATLDSLAEVAAPAPPKVRTITPPPKPARPENRGVARMLEDLEAGRRPLGDIVAELADGDRHADLSRLLGEIAAVDDSQILRVLVRADANGIGTVARGMGIEPAAYARIVELRRRKLKFAATQARWENEQYARLDPTEAQATLATFSDRRKQS